MFSALSVQLSDGNACATRTIQRNILFYSDFLLIAEDRVANGTIGTARPVPKATDIEGVFSLPFLFHFLLQFIHQHAATTAILLEHIMVQVDAANRPARACSLTTRAAGCVRRRSGEMRKYRSRISSIADLLDLVMGNDVGQAGGGGGKHAGSALSESFHQGAVRRIPLRSASRPLAVPANAARRRAGRCPCRVAATVGPSRLSGNPSFSFPASAGEAIKAIADSPSGWL